MNELNAALIIGGCVLTTLGAYKFIRYFILAQKRDAKNGIVIDIPDLTPSNASHRKQRGRTAPNS